MRPVNTPASLAELTAATGTAADVATEAVRLALMVSGQDTVLPARSRYPSLWEGRFLYNLELATEDGPVDAIRLLAGGCMALVRFGATASDWAPPPRLRGALRVVRSAPVPGLPCVALLLRPDGYIAWAADTAGDLVDIDEAVAAWLTPRSGAATMESATPVLTGRVSAGV